MQERTKWTLGLLLGFAVLAAPLTAAAENVGIAPPDLDYGEVDLGETITLPLTISSLGPTPLMISAVEITDDPNGVFEITYIDPIPPELIAGDSIYAEVTFSADVLGTNLGTLTIVSNDREDPTMDVSLMGEVVDPSGEPTPGELMDALLAFYDAAVDDGDIDGFGHCWRAQRAHRRAFRAKLQLLSLFINWGLDRPACRLLRWLDLRTDGDRRPRDFLVGDAVPELNDMIVELRDAMGCP